MTGDEARYRAAADLGGRGFTIYQRVIGGAGNGAPALLALAADGSILRVVVATAIERADGRLHYNRARTEGAHLVALVTSAGEVHYRDALGGDLSPRGADAADPPRSAPKAALGPVAPRNGAISGEGR